MTAYRRSQAADRDARPVGIDDALRGLLHNVQYGDRCRVGDLLVKIMSGVTRDCDVVGTRLLEPDGDVFHLGERVGFVAVEDEGRAVRNRGSLNTIMGMLS